MVCRRIRLRRILDNHHASDVGVVLMDQLIDDAMAEFADALHVWLEENPDRAQGGPWRKWLTVVLLMAERERRQGLN